MQNDHAGGFGNQALVSNKKMAAPSSIAPVAVDTQDDAYFDSGSDIRSNGRWLADATATFKRVRHIPVGHKIVVGAVVALSIAIVSIAGIEAMKGSSSAATTNVAERSAHTASVTRAGHDTTPRARTPVKRRVNVPVTTRRR